MTPLEDDREAAVVRLREAYAEGHISHEEMDRRLDQALAAASGDDLAQAVASLPAASEGGTATIGAAAGRIRRRGAWRVPRVLKVESAYGNVHLDLSRAVLEQPLVDIELQLGTGRAKIIVPRDAIVEADEVRSGYKDIRYQPRQPSRPGGPRIRITGVMGFGRLTIRHAWR
ncbi:DUF1707 SHOCT-like domain-containing protein [Streptomyces hainanensis]|uniref:DUF1707 and DUF2154 domain-containing protein n=1 Tax=Streptomyces hainanensis TaxID=402648 RepID=A0A4R4TPI1_9ACTN|nr:DUF1707 domain-containing protein [Streptomyces hainanensis]TDC77083.1 DUF1707 and DUF2154 domain-containing protein [Streptomyces hainanensis]